MGYMKLLTYKNFDLSHSDRDQILSDRNFSHEEYFCIEKKLQVRWTHNENLLRCRTTLDGIRTGREDSMLIFVKRKPVLLYSQ